MKKILIVIIVFLSTNAFAHTDHYKKYNKIEMDIYRNGELIGYNYYFFTRKGKETTVTNQIKFSVKLLGATVFQVEGYGEEKYVKDVYEKIAQRFNHSRAYKWNWIEALIASVPIAILVMLIVWINQFQDAPSDAAVGKNTWVVRTAEQGEWMKLEKPIRKPCTHIENLH